MPTLQEEAENFIRVWKEFVETACRELGIYKILSLAEAKLKILKGL